MGRQWRSLPAVRALRRGVFSLVTVARLGFNLLSLPTHTHTHAVTHQHTKIHEHTHTHSLSPSTPTLTPPLHPDFISSLAWQRARRSISTATIIIPTTVAEESNFPPGKYAYCRGADKSQKENKNMQNTSVGDMRGWCCDMDCCPGSWYDSPSQRHIQIQIPFFYFPSPILFVLLKNNNWAFLWRASSFIFLLSIEEK